MMDRFCSSDDRRLQIIRRAAIQFSSPQKIAANLIAQARLVGGLPPTMTRAP
jgi:hypothetical protein